jgi:hypothetical protein
MTLNVAFNYSGRSEIVDAVQRAMGEGIAATERQLQAALERNNIKLIEDCANSIAEDQKLADQTYGDVRDRYLASIQSHRHWKRQLDRILRGKTANEDVSNFLQHEGVAQ